MIIGIGIDMIEVDRVESKIAKENGFRESIFSQNEIDYCERQPMRGEHYAARFAAKEAFLKATGLGLTYSFNLNEIELLNDEHGKPRISLHGDFKLKATSDNWNTIHVSISHLREMASAVVIVEQ